MRTPWKGNAKVTTAEDKLLARIERNKQKAITVMDQAIEKAEKDDKCKKYGVGIELTNEDKQALKDYIKLVDADIKNPSNLEDYEPPQLVI